MKTLDGSSSNSLTTQGTHPPELSSKETHALDLLAELIARIWTADRKAKRKEAQ